MEGVNRSHAEGASAAHADLDAIDAARSAAVGGAKSPSWLHPTLALVIGTAFGFGIMGGVLGWAVFWSLLTVFIVLGLIGARRVRRRGRLIDGRTMGWRFLWIFVFVIILNFIGTVTLPAQQQPWLAVAAGVFVAVFTYVFFRWDEASLSKRMASGDFDPYTLF